MKFHPGKIITIMKPSSKDVISANASTQVMIEMWDENILTFTIDSKIATKAKKNDIVIVDYNPTSEKMQIPKTIITKILRGKVAEETWRKYKDYLKKKKELAKKQKIAVPIASQPQAVPKSVYG
jgi:protein associated with RNAse G/E|tara:strand:+ start:2760 stop:3131 length:372 start_codon:yes stop_codon:yes gene_type:complete